MKLQKNKNILYCFSPPVMLATIAIELALLIYIFVRLKQSTIKTLALLTLLILAVFQVAEFNVCGGFGQSALFWSRVGYVAITFLPAIGIHGVTVIAGKRNTMGIVFSYSLAAAFALFFALAPSSVNSAMCAGNYVIFQLHDTIALLYYLFYNAMLFAGIGLALVWRKGLTNKSKRAALVWYVVGYLVFLVPTGIVFAMNPRVINALPSIMCGFAVLFALIVVLKVVPLAIKGEAKSASKK